jgi:hypothetical protein
MQAWFKKSGKVSAAAARRITGISTPFGGLQWADAGPSDGKIVREFVLFLEDRRVLYNPMYLEVVSQVENSIHEIREQCTKTLQALTPKAFGVIPIRAITALGAVRATVGQQVALLAAHYDFDIEGDLASTLPKFGSA